MPAYKDSDFIDVVDEDGNPQPDPIPKSWLGTEFAPGLKKAGGKKKSDDPSAPVEIPEGDPNEDWTNAQLDAYAAAKEIDVSSAKNKADRLALLAAPPTVEVTGQ